MVRALYCALALVFVGTAVAAESVPVVRFSVVRFIIEGQSPLSAPTMQAVLAPFTGEHEGLEGLRAAADALEARLRSAGYPFYRVSLPAQTLKGGAVVLHISRVVVSRIKVTGNQHFSTANVRAAVPELVPGRSPNTKRMSRELLLANDHPARHIDLRFRESETPGALDAVLAVKDSRPQSVFVAINNTGTSATDESRATVGYQHSNLFDRDHNLTVTYTTSPRKPQRVKQVGVNYRVPFYRLGGALSAFWTYSNVDTGSLAGFDVSGAGRFYGLSWLQHLPRLGRYRQTLTASLEDREFLDTTRPVVAPIGVDSRSRPVSLRYAGRYPFPRGSLNGYLGYTRNIPRGRFNDGRSYTARRFGASPNWDALRVGGGFTHTLPAAWLLVARFDAQFAGEPLIPGEQFGVGGAASVRGFDERALSGDNGYTASVEAWAPRWKYGIRLLGFVDDGYFHSERRQPGDLKPAQVASAGVGLRWAWREHLSAQIDWAKVLAGAGGVSAGSTKIHLNVVYRY